MSNIFRFLDLPSELRNHVYRHVLCSSPCRDYISITGLVPHPAENLLCVSRQVYEEAKDIFEKHTRCGMIFDGREYNALPSTARFSPGYANFTAGIGKWKAKALQKFRSFDIRIFDPYDIERGLENTLCRVFSCMLPNLQRAYIKHGMNKLDICMYSMYCRAELLPTQDEFSSKPWDDFSKMIVKSFVNSCSAKHNIEIDLSFGEVDRSIRKSYRFYLDEPKSF